MLARALPKKHEKGREDTSKGSNPKAQGNNFSPEWEVAKGTPLLG